MIVDGTNISIVSGDTDSLTVGFYDATVTPEVFVPFVPGDNVYLTVKENVYDVNAVIAKHEQEFVDGKAVFNFLPEDTQDLRFKTYIYDIKLVTVLGVEITILSASAFTVAETVTG